MNDFPEHEKYMSRCLQLAKLGKGSVSPNPLVGSVIVYKGRIIGEGYHQTFGKAHAEVNAINSVNDQDTKFLKSSTIYVNLEPCAHFGKTPPCADLIVEKGFKTVVVGCIDPYAEVAGKGIKKLRDAGIEVILNVLNMECLDLNRRFFKFHQTKKPYVILKWAQSNDGFMDIDRSDSTKGIFWISQPDTKSLVHKWRSEEDGILVGRKTIEVDNPILSCRNYTGLNPTRIIIDPDGKLLPQKYKISQDNIRTIIFNQKENKVESNVNWIKVNPFNLDDILTQIYRQNIQSVIVEGGKKTLESFIDQNYWDEIRIITGVSNIEKGKKAPQIAIYPRDDFYFGEDLISIIQR
ncbi:MAG: bifunctional diaminohydroxyphosphoribosylaminopyrimidine deaminase/5-amino-6-(5-phosphoribosylamino)uracil reductase RibD [Crocinitomicaceae bacterium]